MMKTAASIPMASKFGTMPLTGIVTETTLDLFTVDMAFQGSDGIGVDGSLYTEDARVSQVDRQIRTRSEKTYVLADSSKIGSTALITHGFLKDITALITDAALVKTWCQALEKTGAKIIIAEQL